MINEISNVYKSQVITPLSDTFLDRYTTNEKSFAYSDEIATRFRSIPPLRSDALRHPCRSVATLVTLCCQNSSF